MFVSAFFLLLGKNIDPLSITIVGGLCIIIIIFAIIKIINDLDKKD